MIIGRNRITPGLIGVAVVCLLGAGIAAAKYAGKHASSGEPAATATSTLFSESVTVPAGTPIPVRLDQSLDSAQNRSGDSFDAHVSAPVVIDGQTLIPQNARIHGRVVDASASGHLKHPGRLEIGLTEVEVGGEWYQITTNETGRKGGSHKNRDIGWIGGSAAGGALIGALAGGGKGALIGGPLGAGAGTAVAYLTGKKDVHLPAETPLMFHISQPLALKTKS